MIEASYDKVCKRKRFQVPIHFGSGLGKVLTIVIVSFDFSLGSFQPFSLRMKMSDEDEKIISVRRIAELVM